MASKLKEKAKSAFNPMAEAMTAGLGPGRGCIISTYLHSVENGYCGDIEGTIAAIRDAMSTHDPTRDQKKDIILNPADMADWAKIGVPGGPDYLREVHRKTPRKEAPASAPFYQVRAPA